MSQPDPLVYLPLRSEPPPAAALVIRSEADLATAASAIRETVQSIDSDLPVSNIMTMAQAQSDAGWNVRTGQGIIWTNALVTLLLSAIGLYAVTAYGVRQRLRELAIKITLGARPAQVRWMVLRRVLGQLALGAAAGFVFTWGAGISAWDPGPDVSGPYVQYYLLVPGSLILVMVGVAACLPAIRRAMRLEPMDILRWE